METFNRQVAQRLRERLAQTGITQAELAKDLGITKSGVSAIFITGEVKAIRLPILAKKLNTTVDYLLTGTGHSCPHASTEPLNGGSEKLTDSVCEKSQM